MLRNIGAALLELVGSATFNLGFIAFTIGGPVLLGLVGGAMVNMGLITLNMMVLFDAPRHGAR